MEPLIEVRNLHRSFGELHAVDGVNFQLAPGEIYGLVGPDGAGKTTTIRLLCGAMLPDKSSGDGGSLVRIAGYDMARQSEQARAHIGYLPQRFSLYEDLTVMENLRFFAEVRGLKASEWKPRCLEILKFVGLDRFTELRAGKLSGGMKQKLGLAAALVHQPQVLLLDEPTTGVDPVTRQDFWQLIIRLAGGERGVAVLISTPYMDEAARCSRVGFLHHGRLLVEGSPEALIRPLFGRVLEVRGEPLPALRHLAKSITGVEDAQLFGDRLHLRIQEGAADSMETRLVQTARDEGMQVRSLRQISPGLEDVFIALLEQSDGGR